MSTASQLEYAMNRGRARAGRVVPNTLLMSRSRVNASGSVVEIVTVVNVAANTTVYSLTVEGMAISFTSGGAASQASISTGLAAAANADAILRSILIATAPGNDLILTAREAGTTLEVVSTGAGSLTPTTSPVSAEASTLDYARFVFRDVNTPRGVILPSASLLSAQEVVLTPTAENTITYTVSVTTGGVTYLATYLSDGSATDAEIVNGILALLNAQLPALSVLAANDGDTLKLTAEVVGVPFTYGYGATSATAIWAVSGQLEGPSTDVVRMIEGITFIGDNKEARTIGGDDAKFAPNDDVDVATWTDIYMEISSATEASSVYLGLSGAEAGKVFTASSSTRRLLPPSLARFVEASIGDKAVLHINR